MRIDYSVIWTTRDGREIPLAEMSDSHVQNAVRVLAEWRRDAKRRGEQPIVRELSSTLGIFKTESRRRLKVVRQTLRLSFR